MSSQPRQRSREREFQHATSTRSRVPHQSSTVESLQTSRTPSCHKHDRRHQLNVCSASLERPTSGSTDCSSIIRRKPTRDSSVDDNFRLRPVYIDSASLDRKTSGKNAGRKVDRDEERTKGCRSTKTKERRTLSVEDDEEQFDVDERGGAGTTWSCARARTRQRSSDVSEIRGRSDVSRDQRQTWIARHGVHHADPHQHRQSTSLKRDKDFINQRSRALGGTREDWTQTYQGRTHDNRPTRDRDSREDWTQTYQGRTHDNRPPQDRDSRKDWTQTYQGRSHDNRSPRDRDSSSVEDDVDWLNSRWIKRQIHLPISRQRHLLCSDVQRLHPRTSSDAAGHSVRSDRGGRVVSSDRGGRVVNSRTDPHNVCFSRRSNNSSLSHRVSARTAGTELVYRTLTDPAVRVEFTTDNNGNLLKVVHHPSHVQFCCSEFSQLHFKLRSVPLYPLIYC